MKKIIYSLIFVSIFYNPLNVHAASVSYVVINSVSTSTNSFSISVNNIISRYGYTCDILNYTCTQISSSTQAKIDNPLKDMTLEDIAARIASTTKSLPYTPPTYIKLYPEFNYPEDASYLSLSPDGNKLAYFSTDKGMIHNMHSFVVVTKDGKQLERTAGVLKGWELTTDNGVVFGWSSDSSVIVYLDNSSGYPQLYSVDLSKNPKNLVGKKLIDKKYSVIDFAVVDDTVYFTANRESDFSWGLYSLGLRDGKFATIDTAVSYANNLVSINGLVLYTKRVSGADVIRAYDSKNKKVKTFTGIDNVSVSVLPYKIIKNKNVNGILIEPSLKDKTNTAIIWLHGGPYRQTAPQRHPYGSYATYDWILDELVRSGVGVLKLEYPGSMGFGDVNATNIVGSIGVSDVSTLKKAITFMNQKGYSKVYLFGNSYGAYLSLKGAVELNNMISGSVAVAPVTDWKKLIIDVSPTPFETHFGGIPNVKNENLYKKASIVDNLNKLTKPVIIFHGSLDKDVPFVQSEYLFQKMKDANKDVKYYSILGERHVIRGVSANEAICQKLAEFVGVKTHQDLCVFK